MATPHGDRQRNLNAGFTEFTNSSTFQDTQGAFEKDRDPGFGQDASSSDSLHGNLDPSILSLFEDTSSTGEGKGRIDEESEATLLSALSEILDTVIEETLSPFDMLPDSDLLLGQRGQDSKFKKLHSLALPPSDRAVTPRTTRSQRSTHSSTKAEGILSDRQLRPRPRRRPQSTTVQRSDGEEEDLSETRRPFARTFRIESDPALCHDEQQDVNVSVALADLIRHMHPYSLRAGMGEEKKNGREPPEEDVFVDVVGDDELGETLLGVPGVSSLSAWEVEASVERPAEETASTAASGGNNITDDATKRPHRSVLAKTGNVGGVKKTVTFAPEIASVHEYPPDGEASECELMDSQSSDAPEDNEAKADSTPAGSSKHLIEDSEMMQSQHGNKKPRSISLQEYRLLKRKTLPEEEKWAHRTKWPSVPETPGELPPIPCIPGYNPPQAHGKTSSANANLHVPSYVTKRKTRLTLKSPPKQKALSSVFVRAVDPPNPATVPLPSPVPKISPHLSERQQVLQQQSGTNPPHGSHPKCPSAQVQPVAQPASCVPERHSPLLHEPQKCSRNVSDEGSLLDNEVMEEKCSSANAKGSGALTSSVRPMSVGASPRRLAPVQMPRIEGDHQREEEPRQESTNETGIQASDVTSLLEQFETQGLTPPATPPHHIWNPLVPGQRAKPQKAIKQSPIKAIQIIEPRPLPPSKVHYKPQPPTSIPAPSLSLAFMDHDYCGTQEFIHSNKRAWPGTCMHERPNQPRRRLIHKLLDHRTLCEAEHLSGSVLLSPESSPCRLEGCSVRRPEEADVPSGSSLHSPRSPDSRGRTRRRLYRRKCRHSDSSSVSSSCSPSCSSSDSSSSRSPPRKRPRPFRSSSSSSSCSSSCSRSPSPIGQHRCRSPPSSGARSYSSSPDCNQNWVRQRRPREHYQLSRWEEGRKTRKQKAIEERRVVYVGRIRGTMTHAELRDRFMLFGKVEDCTVHFRSHGDHYGFITYYNTADAFAAIENGAKLRQPDELPFDLCFGGRRQFCRSSYTDLDSNREAAPAPLKSRCCELDFDSLLKQAQREVKR